MSDHEAFLLSEQLRNIVNALKSQPNDVVILGVVAIDENNCPLLVPIVPDMSAVCSKVIVKIARRIESSGMPSPRIIGREN